MKAKEKELLIEDLPGVGPATAEKLIVSGFDEMMKLATASPGELMSVSGMTELSAKKVIYAAQKAANIGFATGNEIHKKREATSRITTGSVALNALFGGGIETGAITEVFGEYGSGKTQIGHTLAVLCQKQFPDTTIVYIDTEGTFRSERIIQMSNSAGLDPEKVLSNILVARAYNSDHQMLLVEKVGDLIKDEGKKVKVVVVDSLTAHFRAEFVGRGTLADRQQRLNRHMHALAKLADIYGLAVYVTNQVMVDPAQMFGDPVRAIGGHIVAHTSTYRVYLRKGKKGTRVAKMIDSPHLPDNECGFVVTEEGIKDL